MNRAQVLELTDIEQELVQRYRKLSPNSKEDIFMYLGVKEMLERKKQAKKASAVFSRNVAQK